jgi:anti-sigma factor RsiW
MHMCEQRENLVAYLYDEADANERRSMETHLASCETCREELRAFRDVRQDLLAWDVPAHESVWKPFVTARTQPVWRQVPAWAMAAAAMLVFAIGVAGGFAGRVIAARTAAPADVQVAAATAPAPPAAQPVPAAQAPQLASATPSVSLDEFRALQSRIGNIERAALTRPASSSAPAVSDAAILAQVEQLIRESEGRVNHKTSQKILSIIADMDKSRRADNAMLLQQISDMQERTNGSILTLKNQRVEKEKE